DLDAFDRNTDNGQLPILAHFLTRARSLTFIDTRDVLPEITPLTVSFEVDKPTAIEQRATWTQVLGPAGEGDLPTQLASQFNLNLTTIQQIAEEVLSRADDTLEREVWLSCLAS